MLPPYRLTLFSLLISSVLIACNDKSESTAAVTTTIEPTAQPIDAGTSEQTVIDKLGKSTHTQSRVLDALTFTQSEWTNESGTTSVQFQNGTVTFSQFTPAKSQY